MDINKLMEQAQAMQRKMEQAQNEIKNTDYIGEASNGLVKVVIDGENNVKEVLINPEIVNKEDVEMLQDLIVIAMNDANQKLHTKQQETLGKVTGGIKIPGM